MNPGPVPEYESAKEQAKEAIQRQLKDPGSVQFRDTTPFFKTLYNFGLAGKQEPLWALCIEVNAKNSYGGYVGFEYWLVKFRNGAAVRNELGVLKAEYDCKTGPVRGDRLAPRQAQGERVSNAAASSQTEESTAPKPWYQ